MAFYFSKTAITQKMSVDEMITMAFLLAFVVFYVLELKERLGVSKKEDERK